MESLTHRIVNIGIKPKPTQKKTNAEENPPAPQQMPREKDYPPAPPSQVQEPNDGPVYKVGQLLGKGGFAICHKAITGAQFVALKMVKKNMVQKKMAEKVIFLSLLIAEFAVTETFPTVQDRASDTFEDGTP